ncbi:MAG: cyclic nucleotide-binding domain-containing protein [Bdellovibrionales bacterium]|nr:cyclic nucleotide-binding domain-containing protein [Bdellovibrionales bacterium]
MVKAADDEKKVLLVLPEYDSVTLIRGYIESFPSVQSLVTADTGSEAMAKITNDPPHLVVVGGTLKTIKLEKFIHWVLDFKGPRRVAVVWIHEIPEHDRFIDEVVTGQLHFVEPAQAKELFQPAFCRAMNFVSLSEPSNEYRIKLLAPGDQLIAEGEKGEFVYLVKNGNLKARVLREGGEVLLGPIKAGEFVGEMALINGEPRSADVIATSECEVIEFPADKLDHLLFQRPSWSKALLKTLSKRLKETTLRTIDSKD